MSENDPLVPGGRGASSYKPESSFLDHFSLEAPSDEVRFRKCAVRVYSSGTDQFQVIEEEGDKRQKAKISSDGSSNLSALRACYTLVAVLMMGFLLIFCIQVLLFLFVSIISEGGFTSNQNLNGFHLLGTVLSIPVFVYGLASALTMATEFVSDTWNGHQFFRSVLSIPSFLIDWFYFFSFLGIPLTVMIYKMFTSEHWWETTSIVWFACITFSYCLFCLVVFGIEILGALELIAEHPDFEVLSLDWKNIGAFLKRAILLRELQTYSGIQERTFMIEGTTDFPSANVSYTDSPLADTEHTFTKVSPYSKLTKWMPEKIFETLETPRRQYNIEDVLDRVVYVTDSSWNLEKLFCRRQLARQVMVVNGPSRILESQAISSVLCAIIGNGFKIALFAALMSWGGVPKGGVIVLTIFFIAANFRSYKLSYVILDTYLDTKKRREATGTVTGDEADSEAIYQVTETHRITRPSEKICWHIFGAEIFFLFVYPLWMLLAIGNHAIAYLFLILGFFSACRHYFNAPVVLSEVGSLDLLEGEFDNSQPTGERQQKSARVLAEADWQEKNRLAKIVGRISQGARRDTWVGVIATLVFIFLFLFLTAFSAGSNSGGVADTSNILHDFEYVPKEDTFKYPTCAMTSEFQIPGTNSHALADYAYMAGIAYTAPEFMPDLLDAWFGEGVAHDDYDLVTEFRKSHDIHSAVHFKLFTFQDNPEFAVVAIRGTNNGWDMITDAQLWSAAFLAQAVRMLLPFGEMWNPMLDDLVSWIAVVQSESLREVAFYVHTTAFVEYLKSKNMFETLRVTGHSLGGGLAMITGAQTKTPAVALSGPNTIISRHTMEPPVTIDNLNAYTFNIIPDRDPVPLIDDPAKNTQKIACLAATNNFVDCHTATRSLCDIQYTCGSGPRPTLCDCALYYGYPEPEPTGDRTFAEACGI